jgi:hypothetical protein
MDLCFPTHLLSPTLILIPAEGTRSTVCLVCVCMYTCIRVFCATFGAYCPRGVRDFIPNRVRKVSDFIPSRVQKVPESNQVHPRIFQFFSPVNTIIFPIYPSKDEKIDSFSFGNIEFSYISISPVLNIMISLITR